MGEMQIDIRVVLYRAAQALAAIAAGLALGAAIWIVSRLTWMLLLFAAP
jgi:hypothetical protein